MHRISGIGLFIGSILVVIWLFFLALSESYFGIATYFFGTTFGKFILLIWSFVILFHLTNGVRYLVWSIGFGLDLKNVYRSGYLVIVLSFLFTLFLWLRALSIL